MGPSVLFPETKTPSKSRDADSHQESCVDRVPFRVGFPFRPGRPRRGEGPEKVQSRDGLRYTIKNRNKEKVRESAKGGNGDQEVTKEGEGRRELEHYFSSVFLETNMTI